VGEGEGGRPVVKLLDFGIARLLEEDVDEALTRTGGRRLTPAYAAPEQRRGEAVTTAADVYALGIVLYELLTGVRPDEPARPPSAAVTPEAAAARGATAERLRRRLRGDLDTIVLKALREEPEGRYPSVEALLDDLRRHREGLPVLARPASAAYRVRKFVRRHRTGVAAASAFVLLLVAAVVALALQQRQTVRERDRAEVAAQQAREATRFLASVFSEADSARTGGEALSALQVLERGMARAEAELVGQPELLARLFYIFGGIYQRMDRNEAALDACARAYALQRDLYAPVHPEVASTVYCLASAHYGLGNTATADSLFDAFEGMVTALPEGMSPEHAWLFEALGRLLYHRSELDRALLYQRKAYALHLRLYGLVDERSIGSGSAIAQTLVGLGRVDEAASMLKEVLAAFDHLPDFEGRGAMLRSTLILELARIHVSRGEVEEADRAFREAIAVRRRLSSESSALAGIYLSYGELLAGAGRFPAAEAAFREAREGFRHHYGEGSFYTLHAQRMLGEAVRDQGRFEEAEPLLKEAYERLRAERGEADSFTQGALDALVGLYEAWGRPEQAASYRARRREPGA